MKSLLAITTCHRYKNRADAQRNTWLKELTQMDYKFFLGRGEGEPEKDEIFLDVDDSYEYLPWKTRATMKWALDHGYDAVCKMDDDTFVFPERLINILPTTPYEGRINKSNKMLAPTGWCSGFAYWVSGKAIEIIANAPDPNFKAEDLWVGVTLSKHGIKPVKQAGFTVMSVISPALWQNYKDQIIAACEFADSAMYEFNKAMREPIVYYPQQQLISNPDYKTGKRMMRFGDVLRRARR